MSSYFARSLNKAPAYLSPRRRPALPGRTLSNSSDVSLTSNFSGRDEEFGDTVTSAPSTPVFESPGNTKFCLDSPTLQQSPRSTSSRPIAIEIPKSKKLKKPGQIWTPSEPVSARGDLPGGYFPLHEDPKGRIHRPHPFSSDSASGVVKESSNMHSHGSTLVAPAAPLVHANSPTVSSYMPAGLGDFPLPVGKYYPTNYEQRSDALQKQHNFVSESMTTSTKVDSHSARHPQAMDARQRLQQYQRDMVAQAAMALHGSFRAGAKSNHQLSLNGLPGMSVQRKPDSPRLLPLGSPGPVTPMELENAGEGYLGRNPTNNENLAPPGQGYTAHSL